MMIIIIIKLILSIPRKPAVPTAVFSPSRASRHDEACLPTKI